MTEVAHAISEAAMAKPKATSAHRALVIGHGTLAASVVDVLNARGISATCVDQIGDADAAGPVSLVFHLWFPDPHTDSAVKLSDYPLKLLEQSLASAPSLIAAHESPAIINFAFLPAIYVGTALEDHVSTLRGGITGVTRTMARKFGKQGLRVTCVQAGLVDIPETQRWVSDIVKSVQVPTKRWATPSEVAKFLVFLAVDSLYTTGQTMIIDGGLTAGITGT